MFNNVMTNNTYTKGFKDLTLLVFKLVTFTGL